MGKYIDLTGLVYGNLTVHKLAEGRGSDGSRMWLCICKCGTEVITSSNKLRTGHIKSCGCLVYDQLKSGEHHKMLNLEGQRFGRLLVVERTKKDNSYSFWRCLCSCGKYCVVETYNLTSGNTKSCGCLYNENQQRLFKATHRATGTRILTRWYSIKDRCYNSHHPNYHNYGGRGIVMCDRWLGENGFINFIEDMGFPPKGNDQIDRIDTNGNYSPENCRWASSKVQSNNKRNNIYVELFGNTLSLKETCEKYGFDYSLVCCRRNKLMWSMACILLIPCLQQVKNKKNVSRGASLKRELNSLKY